MHGLQDGERPGEAGHQQQKCQHKDALASPERGGAQLRGHWTLRGWRQLNVLGPRRSKAMCLEERSDQSKLRPKAPVTMLRLAWPTVRKPGTTSGRGAL